MKICICQCDEQLWSSYGGCIINNAKKLGLDSLHKSVNKHVSKNACVKVKKK